MARTTLTPQNKDDIRIILDLIKTMPNLPCEKPTEPDLPDTERLYAEHQTLLCRLPKKNTTLSQVLGATNFPGHPDDIVIAPYKSGLELRRITRVPSAKGGAAMTRYTNAVKKYRKKLEAHDLTDAAFSDWVERVEGHMPAIMRSVKCVTPSMSNKLGVTYHSIRNFYRVLMHIFDAPPNLLREEYISKYEREYRHDFLLLSGSVGARKLR